MSLWQKKLQIKLNIEIGPGMGVLSKYIAEKCEEIGFEFLMVEYDWESIDFLKAQSAYDIEGISVIKKDILQYNWSESTSHLNLIGNLPYNISSPIFFKIIGDFENIDSGVFMVQKEVAHRICAMHGSRTYGILSVLLQSIFDCELLFDVEAKSFFPPPKVVSSVFKISKKKNAIEPALLSILKPLVKKAFNQRRKMLRNTIGDELGSLGSASEKYLTLRPEQISVEEFISMAKELQSIKNAL